MERRKGFLDDLLKELDDTCSFILAEITLNPQGMGFNELLKKVRKHPTYRKMAKSTLSEHLRHLMEKKLVDKKVDKDSRLKLKPSEYRTSQHFIQLSKGLIAQSTTPEDYLPFMRTEDVKSVTNHLMEINLQHISECLKVVLQAPENIAVWNMHQAFYNLETLMRAYRERILESKEETMALKALQDWLSQHLS